MADGVRVLKLPQLTNLLSVATSVMYPISNILQIAANPNDAEASELRIVCSFGVTTWRSAGSRVETFLVTNRPRWISGNIHNW